MKKVLLFLNSWTLFPAGMNQFRVECLPQIFYRMEREVKYSKEEWSASGNICSWQHLSSGAFADTFHCLVEDELQSFSLFAGGWRLSEHHNIQELNPGETVTLKVQERICFSLSKDGENTGFFN